MICDVTIATHAACAEGAADDVHLADEFRNAGATVRFAAWSDPDVDWSSSATTVIRSTWDYHLRPAQWSGWISRLERATRLVNAPELVRWNTDKSYLLELIHRGVDVVPTLVATTAQDVDAAFASFRTRGWDDVVVKPAIGASAHGAARFGGRTLAAARDHALGLVRTGSAIIQPFQTGVVEERERSLVMIDGRFSHAFTKAAFDPGAAGGRPAIARHEATERELVLATRSLAALDASPAYARVDMVPTPSGPLLMELELIEPHLALEANPGSAAALASSILTLRPFTTGGAAPGRALER